MSTKEKAVSTAAHEENEAVENSRKNSVFCQESLPEYSITEFTKGNGILTKIVRLKPDRSTIKDASQCRMTRGVAKTKTFHGLKELGEYLPGVKMNQAISHGICGRDEVKILSSQKIGNHPDTISRTKEFFHYPAGPALAMVDYDPEDGQPVYNYDEVILIIDSVCPGFADIPKLLTYSTSSCLYRGDEEITGKGNGFHLYFIVKRGVDLPRFAEVLFQRLWTAGHGFIKISRSGALLQRTIFDAAVFSPERLDFVAGANLLGPSIFTQRRPAPLYIPGGAEC